MEDPTESGWSGPLRPKERERTYEEVQFILGVVFFLVACVFYGLGLDKVVKNVL